MTFRPAVLLGVACCVVLRVGHASDAAEVASGSPQSSAASGDLQEVIVTAQKREERLQDVPVPVAVLSAERLVDANAQRFQDYFASVPGLSLAAGGMGEIGLNIRGLASGGGNPTVAIVLDDAPVSSSAAISGVPQFMPDLDPSDLKQVEVLRGPQGTLYGASGLGGIVKFVTMDPSFDTLSGHIKVDSSLVQHGDGEGYGLRGGVNVPVSATLAIRASTFVRQDPGYIDNPFDGVRGLNKDHSAGAHVAALWRPSESFSLKLSALTQDTVARGASTAFTSLGDLQQGFEPGAGAWKSRLQIFSATAKANFAGVDFVSVSSYLTNNYVSVLDFSPYFGPGAAVYTAERNGKFSQEFRVSSKLGEHLDWLAGVFYTYERSPIVQQIWELDSTRGAFASNLVELNYPSTFAERSAFFDLTVHFTNQVDVQLGGRASHNSQSYRETDTGPLVPALDPGTSPFVFPTVYSSGTSYTYLVTPRIKISDDLMAYLRLASGYRPGGPNSGAVAFQLPAQFGADTTKNYELGVKGDTLGHRLSFDMSLYYIEWNNIQLGFSNPSNGINFYGNGAGAKSEGVDFSAQVHPLEGLTFGGWVAWNEAVLTQNFPASSPVQGGMGDRLPYASRISGQLSAEQEFVLVADSTGILRASIDYIGDRDSVFSSNSLQPRIRLPAYAQLDVLAGAHIKSWRVNLFANNVTNRRGILSSGYFGPGDPSASPLNVVNIRPRTVGLSLEREF